MNDEAGHGRVTASLPQQDLALGRLVVVDHPVVMVPEHEHGRLGTLADLAGQVDRGARLEEELAHAAGYLGAGHQDSEAHEQAHLGVRAHLRVKQRHLC